MHKLIDCFMYFDEDLVLDIRLNTLNEKVDIFITKVKFLLLEWLGKVRSIGFYNKLKNRNQKPL